MSFIEIKETPVVEIFNGMEACDILNNSGVKNCADFYEKENLVELSRFLRFTARIKSLDAAVDVAVKAQNEWKNSTPFKRANVLYKTWKALMDISKTMSKSKKEFSALLNYFDFYADLAAHTEKYKNWKSCGIVLVVLSTNYSPFFVLGATVPSALAAACSVIVLVPEKLKILPLLLQEILVQAGLPKGLFSTVTEFNENDLSIPKEISKVFFCGSYSSAIKLSSRNVTKSFNFFCSGNTAAIILESADLDAAVDKLVRETCAQNSLFAVSSVVIQESIYENFLQKLKYQMQKYINISFDHKNSHITSVNQQNQEVDGSVEDGSMLKILLCRTAKEGVHLLNNSYHYLGISIWSEISSQAVEISSKLACANIWINTHGTYEAGEPLQLSGFSGNSVIGGNDGIFEYLSFGVGDTIIIEEDTSAPKKSDVELVDTLKVAFLAQSAFSIWQHTKNRREYLKDIAECLNESKDLSNLYEVIGSCAHFGNLTTFTQRNSQKHVVLKRKIPVGVFLLLVNNTNIDIKSFASLITLTIAFGNAIIVVLKELTSTVQLLCQVFSNVLPKNVFNVIVGIKNGIHLASDPHVQSIWIYDESAVSLEVLQTVRNHSSSSLKHLWIIPKNLPVCHNFFQKQCLKNQIIWLTDIDQFP